MRGVGDAVGDHQVGEHLALQDVGRRRAEVEVVVVVVGELRATCSPARTGSCSAGDLVDDVQRDARGCGAEDDVGVGRQVGVDRGVGHVGVGVAGVARQELTGWPSTPPAALTSLTARAAPAPRVGRGTRGRPSAGAGRRWSASRRTRPCTLERRPRGGGSTPPPSSAILLPYPRRRLPQVSSSSPHAAAMSERPRKMARSRNQRRRCRIAHSPVRRTMERGGTGPPLADRSTTARGGRVA